MPAAVQKHFEYDPADNLIGKLDQQPAGQHRQRLHYDATGRIIASQDSLHGQRETFAYDDAANLLDGPQPGAGLVVHNKLLTFQDKRYRYDAFGRMIEKRSAKRGLQRFGYDAESRLIEVRNENGSVLRMTYDPLGRRIEKTEHDPNGYPLGETRFTWDGLRLLQENRHQQTSLYLYEDEGYEPLARIDGTGPLQKIRYYHNDLNGLPEQLTEADGHNVWHATYRVWGNTLEEVREPYYIEEQNLRFQGQYLDRETGLHFNTFRFYDPDVGRFTTPDPIGLAGGFNLYQYAPNPIGWVDPWGWEVCRLSTSQKRAMGPAPKGMVKPHYHHIVREKAPKSWKAQNQKYITDSQKILAKHKIGLNNDPRNFTWAQNGGGNHSIASAKKVYEVLQKADVGGLASVQNALQKMGAQMTKGVF